MRTAIIISILFLLSCSSKKRIISIENRTKADLVHALVSRNLHFDTFEGKCSTSLESPDENISGSMLVKMKKDSAILVAVKKFGFEVARFFTNKDGYVILYRLERTYESGSAKHINKIISIQADYSDIQQLILGNVIIPDTATIDVQKDSLGYILSGKTNGLLMEYHVSSQNLQLNKYIITDAFGRKALIEYNNYKPCENKGVLPFIRNITFTDGNGEVSKISLEFSEITIDKAVDIKFNIPNGYEKIN